jgi:hypothetical protein
MPPHLPPPRITRIDFEDISRRLAAPDGSQWVVRKFAQGWTAHTNPCDIKGNPPFNIDRAVAELETTGWTVYRWPGGARAWRGRPEPVRDRAQIIRFRRTIERRRWQDALDFENPRLDLALWY